MNDQDMHEFFRRNEERMHKPMADGENDDTQDANFDNFITAKSGKAFGFYIEEDFNVPGSNKRNWDTVVWIPRSMIDDGKVKVRRIKQGEGTQLAKTVGFVVTMPVWFANKNGVI